MVDTWDINTPGDGYRRYATNFGGITGGDVMIEARKNNPVTINPQKKWHN